MKHNKQGQELMDAVRELMIRAEQELKGLQKIHHSAEDLAERGELDVTDLLDLRDLARAALTWERRTLQSGPARDLELLADLRRIAEETNCAVCRGEAEAECFCLEHPCRHSPHGERIAP